MILQLLELNHESDGGANHNQRTVHVVKGQASCQMEPICGWVGPLNTFSSGSTPDGLNFVHSCKKFIGLVIFQYGSAGCGGGGGELSTENKTVV